MRYNSQNIIPCQQYIHLFMAMQFHATSFVHRPKTVLYFCNHSYPVRSMPGRIIMFGVTTKSLFILSMMI